VSSVSESDGIYSESLLSSSISDKVSSRAGTCSSTSNTPLSSWQYPMESLSLCSVLVSASLCASAAHGDADSVLDASSLAARGDGDSVPDASSLAARGDGDSVPETRPARGDGDSVPDISTAHGDGDSVPDISTAHGDGDSVPDTSTARDDGDSVPDTSTARGDGDFVPDTSNVRGDGVSVACTYSNNTYITWVKWARDDKELLRSPKYKKSNAPKTTCFYWINKRHMRQINYTESVENKRQREMGEEREKLGNFEF